MILFDGAFGLIILALWLFCLIDVITTDSSLCRNLPKPLWIVIVLLLPDIGSIIWLVAGHPWQSAGASNLPYKGNRGPLSAPAAAPRATNPDDDAEFQAALRRRVEQQRRRPTD